MSAGDTTATPRLTDTPEYQDLYITARPGWFGWASDLQRAAAFRTAALDLETRMMVEYATRGMTQANIGAALGITKQAVSLRIRAATK